MRLKKNIYKLERRFLENRKVWLKSLSDEELEKLTENHPEADQFTECFNAWLETLSDRHYSTVRENRPGAELLEMDFYEYYQKQNKKA